MCTLCLVLNTFKKDTNKLDTFRGWEGRSGEGGGGGGMTPEAVLHG